MALTTGTAIALALSAAASAAQYQNSVNTARKQDNAATQAIRNQSAIQQQADADVNNEVQKLAQSNAADDRANRLNQYMATLQRGRQQANAGLGGEFGSDAFRTDSAAAQQAVADKAATTAGLMSRIDAGALQRQGENTSYGNLATDLGLIQRQAAGQAYVDRLRQAAIRRNPYVDLAAGIAGGAAGGIGGAYDAAALDTSAVNAGMAANSANLTRNYDARIAAQMRGIYGG
ncbi:hypothetical protein [Pseudoxanthomonas sp. X-1]|uniref:hypothetical protein n=1 Tax=Pseudoxanthomonas sp. X-1 TaxID=2571115 RepID=UPI00110B249A|nr:hypothetical protein [Pseudoxanthomonas sp. X-1]TMN18467.1 hypothetical protein FF950_14380 [Pseudoxanthomonas sp. X-1]UAY76032.1 hypothetical protein LAJ50_07295 [Pseudoxanthomonas sp. X-1]